MRTGIGYKNIAFDVTGLVELYRARWESIKDRTSVRLDELAEADRFARQVVDAVGLKEQGPVVQGAAAQLRQQAYTLVATTYEDARRRLRFCVTTSERRRRSRRRCLRGAAVEGKGRRPMRSRGPMLARRGMVRAMRVAWLRVAPRRRARSVRRCPER